MQMLTYGRVMPFLELFARIDAVDCATIMQTAKEHIIDKVNLQNNFVLKLYEDSVVGMTVLSISRILLWLLWDQSRICRSLDGFAQRHVLMMILLEEYSLGTHNIIDAVVL